jgi:hypothetical protein
MGMTQEEIAEAFKRGVAQAKPPPPMPKKATEAEAKSVFGKEGKKIMKEAKKAVKKVAAKKPAKVATKKVAKVAKPKASKKQAKRVVGPGTAKFKFKKEKLVGQCDVLGCKAKAHKPNAYRCMKHKKEIRKVQLAANNVVWHKRVKAKTADHHIVYTYDGKQKLSKWARAHPDAAMERVKKEQAVIDLDQFKKLVELSKSQAKSKQIKTAKAKQPKRATAKAKPASASRPRKTGSKAS